MATILPSLTGGSLSFTGTAYTGTRAIVSVQFTSTDNRRRYIETHHAPVTNGTLSYTVNVPTGGMAIVRTFDTSYALQATSASQAT